MPTPASHLAVIIPLGSGEETPISLFTSLPKSCEVYLVASDHFSGDHSPTQKLPRNVTWLHCPAGNRATALNLGIKVATQLDNHTSFPLYFWILHADSRLSKTAVKHLCRRITPEKIYYAKLRFFDGSKLLWLNAKLANLRSRLFNMPFGDQGFCFSQHVWHQAGPFDETAAYGEDNVFIKHARTRGIKLQQLPFTIQTSGRKYTTHGWLKTTARHVWLGYQQRWGNK